MPNIKNITINKKGRAEVSISNKQSSLFDC